MGILVICSYKAKPAREGEARRLIADHVPMLRKHGLITDRQTVRGEGADGAFIEVFEWASEEKSRAAPAIPDIGNLWKAMAEEMDFVPLASFSEAQKPFAHFAPLQP